MHCETKMNKGSISPFMYKTEHAYTKKTSNIYALRNEKEQLHNFKGKNNFDLKKRGRGEGGRRKKTSSSESKGNLFSAEHRKQRKIKEKYKKLNGSTE